MTDTPRITAGKRLARQAGYFIREHSEQKFSLNEIAGALYVNGNYLARVFKRETGHTLLWYHNSIRCERAKQLLSDTDLSVSEVSEAVGFVSPAHFSHVFRKITGFAPSSWRECPKNNEKEVDLE
jgi:two-component system response regulator YesN